MNLEQLRKQAKELVRAARAGDAEALERLGGREPILASAQLVFARENGYPSWPALVAASEASADAFARAATDSRRDTVPSACWRRGPRSSKIRGPRSSSAAAGTATRTSRVARGTGRRSCTSATPASPLPQLARELLERGADPNATFTNEYGEMSALYGAAGVVHDPELTQDPAGGRREPRRRRIALPLGRAREH